MKRQFRPDKCLKISELGHEFSIFGLNNEMRTSSHNLSNIQFICAVNIPDVGKFA